MKPSRVYWFLLMLIGPLTLRAQGPITRFTYHDPAHKLPKEIYQVKDTLSNTLHGRFISYYLNGNIESKGQFVNNESSGVWEFYYETGNLKMRGILRQSSNFGLWEYFYENGVKSMEGTINGKNREGMWKVYYESGELRETGEYKENKREGPWKMLFEDGTIRGEVEYQNDEGRFTEYYHSGKLLAVGLKTGPRNTGHWRFFAEDGAVEGEGDYVNNHKQGDWKYYFPSGKVSSAGKYENDLPTGKWTYYFEDGKVSSSGEYVGGKMNGYWSTLRKDGTRTEIAYSMGSGEFREYFANGKLKSKGQLVEGKYDGKWLYYGEDGKLQGECDFDHGSGYYVGYFPNGTIQTKGKMEGDLRVGIWELFEQDGKLSGYYKPFYENNLLANEIGALLNKPQKSVAAPPAIRHGFNYFKVRNPEYHGVIVSADPIMSFIGTMPFGVEFYNQERLGHEFIFEAMRNPFYTSDAQVARNKIYNRGYAIAVRQKFYNPLKTGMWYFAQEIRFTNQGYFSNVPPPPPQSSSYLITATATEQKAEYGILLGTRMMRRNDGDGFTIDLFVGYAIGYRLFDVEPIFASEFSSLTKDHFAQTFRFGLNFGYSVSFDGHGRR